MSFGSSVYRVKLKRVPNEGPFFRLAFILNGEINRRFRYIRKHYTHVKNQFKRLFEKYLFKVWD